MFFNKLFSKKEKTPPPQPPVGQRSPTPPQSPTLAQTEDDKGERYYLLKILLIGDQSSNKTSVLSTYSTCGSPADKYKSSTGMDFISKTVITPSGDVVKLQLYDMAGHEISSHLTPLYFKGVHGIFLCYNSADRASFEYLKSVVKFDYSWITDPNVTTRIVGISKDEFEKKIDSQVEVQALADSVGAKVSECCLDDKKSINDVFNSLVIDIGKKNDVDYDVEGK